MDKINTFIRFFSIHSKQTFFFFPFPFLSFPPEIFFFSFLFPNLANIFYFILFLFLKVIWEKNEKRESEEWKNLIKNNISRVWSCQVQVKDILRKESQVSPLPSSPGTYKLYYNKGGDFFRGLPDWLTNAVYSSSVAQKCKSRSLNNQLFAHYNFRFFPTNSLSYVVARVLSSSYRGECECIAPLPDIYPVYMMI